MKFEVGDKVVRTTYRIKDSVLSAGDKGVVMEVKSDSCYIWFGTEPPLTGRNVFMFYEPSLSKKISLDKIHNWEKELKCTQ